MQIIKRLSSKIKKLFQEENFKIEVDLHEKIEINLHELLRAIVNNDPIVQDNQNINSHKVFKGLLKYEINNHFDSIVKLFNIDNNAKINKEFLLKNIKKIAKLLKIKNQYITTKDGFRDFLLSRIKLIPDVVNHCNKRREALIDIAVQNDVMLDVVKILIKDNRSINSETLYSLLEKAIKKEANQIKSFLIPYCQAYSDEILNFAKERKNTDIKNILEGNLYAINNDNNFNARNKKRYSANECLIKVKSISGVELIKYLLLFIRQTKTSVDQRENQPNPCLQEINTHQLEQVERVTCV